MRFSHGFFQLLQMVVGCSVNFLAYRYKTDGEHGGGEVVMVVMMMVVMVMMMVMMMMMVMVMVMVMMMTMVMMVMTMRIMMMVVKIKLLQIKVLFPPCTKSHAECATDMHRSEQDDTENQSQSDCSARIQDWAAHIQDQPKSGKP